MVAEHNQLFDSASSLAWILSHVAAALAAAWHSLASSGRRMPSFICTCLCTTEMHALRPASFSVVHRLLSTSAHVQCKQTRNNWHFQGGQHSCTERAARGSLAALHTASPVAANRAGRVLSCRPSALRSCPWQIRCRLQQAGEKRRRKLARRLTQPISRVPIHAVGRAVLCVDATQLRRTASHLALISPCQGLAAQREQPSLATKGRQPAPHAHTGRPAGPAQRRRSWGWHRPAPPCWGLLVVTERRGKLLRRRGGGDEGPPRGWGWSQVENGLRCRRPSAWLQLWPGCMPGLAAVRQLQLQRTAITTPETHPAGPPPAPGAAPPPPLREARCGPRGWGSGTRSSPRRFQCHLSPG